jgi:hypothetical protein
MEHLRGYTIYPQVNQMRLEIKGIRSGLLPAGEIQHGIF